jgi:hypothetical protein
MINLKELLGDDKILIILAITVLGICTIFSPGMTPQAAEIIKLFGSGLLGAAVGKGMN